MSVFCNALDNFFNYLHLNYPDYANSSEPRLSKKQIKEMTQSLPFELTATATELFQRINSYSKVKFLGYIFQPLEEEIRLYHDIFSQSDGNLISPSSYVYLNKPLFAILRFDHDTISVICDKVELKDSSVYICTEMTYSSILFGSLTSMMQTLTEGLEAGAIYLDEEYNCFRKDTKKITPIYKKYNSSVPLMIAEWVKINGLYGKFNSDQFFEQCLVLKKFWSDITLEQLGDSEAIEIILKASQDKSDDYIQHNVWQAIEVLNYPASIVDEL
jgi:hypothetical protein